MFLGGAADTGGKSTLDVALRSRQGDGLAFGVGELLRRGFQQGGDEPLPPAGESSVVHGDFPGGVEDVPGLDLDGDGGVDDLEEELEAAWGKDVSVWYCERFWQGGRRKGEEDIPSRSRGYVLTGCEVGNLIRSWNAEQREGIGIIVGVC